MDTSKVLAEMALELEQERSTEQTIKVVCEYAVRLLDADDAGLLLIHTRSKIETPAATSSRVDVAHQLQAELDEGPCLDAIDGRATYTSSDVRNDERWLAWGAAAADIGINSAVGVRLATRERGYGSLNVYADRPGAFDDRSARIVEILAAHATAALAASTREKGLTEALESRTVIGQAQGILMEKFDLEADAAFEFLKRISQHENLRLRAVAEAIAVQRDANARP